MGTQLQVMDHQMREQKAQYCKGSYASMSQPFLLDMSRGEVIIGVQPSTAYNLTLSTAKQCRMFSPISGVITLFATRSSVLSTTPSTEFVSGVRIQRVTFEVCDENGDEGMLTAWDWVDAHTDLHAVLELDEAITTVMFTLTRPSSIRVYDGDVTVVFKDGVGVLEHETMSE
jgi:hypothetical protein